MLDQTGREQRGAAIAADIAGGYDTVRELPDGYALRFSDPAAPEKLFAFINAERRYCPFFTFELAFEPDNGPVWLRLRGAEGVKAFVRDSMGLAG
jgi:hypothetical protein